MINKFKPLLQKQKEAFGQPKFPFGLIPKAHQNTGGFKPSKTIAIKKGFLKGKPIYKEVDVRKMNPTDIKNLVAKMKQEADHIERNELKSSKPFNILNALRHKAKKLRDNAELFQRIATEKQVSPKPTGLIPQKPGRKISIRPNGLLVKRKEKLLPILRKKLINHPSIQSNKRIFKKVYNNEAFSKNELTEVYKITSPNQPFDSKPPKLHHPQHLKPMMSVEIEPLTSIATKNSDYLKEVKKPSIFADYDRQNNKQEEMDYANTPFHKTDLSSKPMIAPTFKDASNETNTQTPSENSSKEPIDKESLDPTNTKPSLWDRMRENPVPYALGTAGVMAGGIAIIRIAKRNKKKTNSKK